MTLPPVSITVFVGVGEWIAPVRRATALVLGAVVILFAGFSLALVWLSPYTSSSPPWRIVLSLLSPVAGAGYADWRFASLSDEQLRR